MKRIILSVLLAFFSTSAFAQIEIGIKVFPTIASNRLVAEYQSLETTSPRLQFGGGLVLDYFFTPNYALSTGINYTTKGSGVQYSVPANTQPVTDRFIIQYIELPVMMKLYTNEVATDVKLYFHLGPSLNTRIGAKVNDDRIIAGQPATRRFNLFEVGAVLGGGAEWQLGQTTRIFGGITYQRGLSNIDRFYRSELNDRNLSIKNDIFLLETGIKF
jgi:hypothetical protein